MAKWTIKPTDAMRSLVADKGSDKKKFQLMVEFEEEGDSWCLTEIEGCPVPGHEDDGKDKKPAKGKFVEAYGNAIKGQPTAPMGGNYASS